LPENEAHKSMRGVGMPRRMIKIIINQGRERGIRKFGEKILVKKK